MHLIRDDESPCFLPYDIMPSPEDLVPESGVLWHASKASREKGVRAAADIIIKEFA